MVSCLRRSSHRQGMVAYLNATSGSHNLDLPCSMLIFIRVRLNGPLMQQLAVLKKPIADGRFPHMVSNLKFLMPFLALAGQAIRAI